MAPRLHALCIPLVVSDAASPALVSAATDVLGRLYLTGAQSGGRTKELAGGASGGKASQAQLWLATIKAATETTRQAWFACSSTLQRKEVSTGKVAREGFPQAALPQDPFEAHAVATRHLDRFLGSEDNVAGADAHQGVLLHLLSIRTSKTVPVPLSSLISLCASILSLSPTSPPLPSVDASLHALQAVKVSQIQSQTLRLLSVLLKCVAAGGTAARARFGLHIIEILVRVLERGTLCPPSVRAPTCELLKVALAGELVDEARDVAVGSGHSGQSPLPLDPSARITIRATKVCLSEIARLLTPTEQELDSASATSLTKGSSAQAPTTVSSSSSTSHSGGRKRKHNRMYESDAIFAGHSSTILGLKSAGEQASSIACLAAFPALISVLSTSQTAVQYDLAHAGSQVICTLADLTLRQAPAHEGGRMGSWEVLASASLRSLAGIVRASSGPLLGLVSPRLSDLAVFALSSAGRHSPAVEAAAHQALVVLREVCLPRLPPLLTSREEPSASDDAADAAAAVEEALLSRDWGVDASTGAQVRSKTGMPVSTLGTRGDGVIDAVADTVGVRLGARRVHAHTRGADSEDVADDDDDDDDDDDVEKENQKHVEDGDAAMDGEDPSATLHPGPLPSTALPPPSHRSPLPSMRRTPTSSPNRLQPTHRSPSPSSLTTTTSPPHAFSSSMEPTKPLHRPSTPRIGSPHSRNASGQYVHHSPRATGVGGVGGGAGGAANGGGTALVDSEEGAAEEVGGNVEAKALFGGGGGASGAGHGGSNPSTQGTTGPAQTDPPALPSSSSSLLASDLRADSDDSDGSDDEEIPAIDLRSDSE